MKAVAVMTHSIDAHDMDSVVILFGEKPLATANKFLAAAWAEEDADEAVEDGKLGKLTKEEFEEKRKEYWLKHTEWKEDSDHFHGDYICTKGKDIGTFQGIAVAAKDIPKETTK